MEHGPRTPLAAVAEIAASAQPGIVVLEDATRHLTYRKLMTGVSLLAGQWRRLLGPDPGERVGVLLPNANATPVTYSACGRQTRSRPSSTSPAARRPCWPAPNWPA